MVVLPVTVNSLAKAAEYQKEGLDNIEIEKRLNMLCNYKSGVTREIIVK